MFLSFPPFAPSLALSLSRRCCCRCCVSRAMAEWDDDDFLDSAFTINVGFDLEAAKAGRLQQQQQQQAPLPNAAPAPAPAPSPTLGVVRPRSSFDPHDTGAQDHASKRQAVAPVYAPPAQLSPRPVVRESTSTTSSTVARATVSPLDRLRSNATIASSSSSLANQRVQQAQSYDLDMADDNQELIDKLMRGVKAVVAATSSSSSSSSSNSHATPSVLNLPLDRQSHLQAKAAIPRIPGPAGLFDLPADEQSPSLGEGQRESELDDEHAPQPKSAIRLITSRSRRSGDELRGPDNDPNFYKDFTSGAWLSMLLAADLPPFAPASASAGEQAQRERSLLRHNIRAISHPAYPSRVPSLIAMVSLCRFQDRDNYVHLKDPTGAIEASVHRHVLDQHPNQIVPGAVLVLRKTVLYSLNTTSRYLIIRAENIVRVFDAVLDVPPEYLALDTAARDTAPTSIYAPTAPPKAQAPRTPRRAVAAALHAPHLQRQGQTPPRAAAGGGSGGASTSSPRTPRTPANTASPAAGGWRPEQRRTHHHHHHQQQHRFPTHPSYSTASAPAGGRGGGGGGGGYAPRPTSAAGAGSSPRLSPPSSSSSPPARPATAATIQPARALRETNQAVGSASSTLQPMSPGTQQQQQHAQQQQQGPSPPGAKSHGLLRLSPPQQQQQQQHQHRPQTPMVVPNLDRPRTAPGTTAIAPTDDDDDPFAGEDAELDHVLGSLNEAELLSQR